MLDTRCARLGEVVVSGSCAGACGIGVAGAGAARTGSGSATGRGADGCTTTGAGSIAGRAGGSTVAIDFSLLRTGATTATGGGVETEGGISSTVASFGGGAVRGMSANGIANTPNTKANAARTRPRLNSTAPAISTKANHGSQKTNGQRDSSRAPEPAARKIPTTRTDGFCSSSRRRSHD